MNRRWLFWGIVGALLVGLLVHRQLPDNKLHLFFYSDPVGDSVILRTPTGHYFLLTNVRSGTLLLNQVGADLPFWQHKLTAVVIIGQRDEVKGSVATLLPRYHVEAVVLPAGGWFGPGSEALQMGAEKYHVPLLSDHSHLQQGNLSLLKTDNGWRLRFGNTSFLLFCHHPTEDALFCHLPRPLKLGETSSGVLILPQLPAKTKAGCTHLPCYLIDRPDRLELVSDSACWKVKR